MKMKSKIRFGLIAILALVLSILCVFAACETLPDDTNPEVESISVDATNVKKTFYQGDEFTSQGLAVVVNYKGGTKSTITSGFDVSAPDMTVTGEKDVVVTYAEKQDSYKITVLSADLRPVPHECTSKCDICNKCTDSECNDKVCEDKCPQHFTVSFVLGEGVEGTITGFENKVDTGASFKLPSADGLKKEGFVFDCWNDGENDYEQGESYVMPAHDVTFTAKWIEPHDCTSKCDVCNKCTDSECNEKACKDKCPLHYTVSFVLGDGVQGTITGFDNKFDTNAVIKLPSADGLKKEGFAFDCWNDGEKDYNEGDSYTVTKDVTFTAKWVESHDCTSKCEICNKCTNSQCNEKACEDKCPLHYTVTFVLGEDVQGTITGFDNKFDTNAVIKLPSAGALRKEGYAFDCWNDGEKDYNEGDSYTVTKDVTFTAKWTNSWDKLYGKTSENYTDGSEKTSGYVDGKTYAFNPARGEFIYEGEDAKGSGLSPQKKDGSSGGSVLDGFGNYERTLTFEVYSTCNYTALFSIAVTGNDGLGANHKASYYFTVKNTTNNFTVDCSDTDIIAGNWSASPILYAENLIGEIALVAGRNVIEVKVDKTNFTSGECIQIDYMSLSPKVYDVTADEPAPRTIYFDLGDANGTMNAIECHENQIVTVPELGSVTYEGYLFDGYMNGSKHVAPGDVIVVGADDITLVAVWKRDYRPEWQDKYGTPDKSSYVDGSKNAFVPARGAYIYEAEDATLGSGLNVEDNKPNASGNKQLGGFTTAKRTVTFEVYSLYQCTALIALGYTSNPNLSETTFADHFMSITYGTDGVVNCANSLLNKGDWGTDTYVESYIGTINLVEGVNTITFEFVNLGDPNTICLDYMLIMPEASGVTPQQQYTLSYDVGEDVEGTIAGGQYYEGEYLNVAYATDISKLGHYFDCWSYDGRSFNGGDKFIMPKGNVTFVAQWEQSATYTVTYNLDGGSGTESAQAMAGSRFFLPEDGYTKQGYTLGGWLFEDVYYALGAEFIMPEGDITIDAIWLADSDLWNEIYGETDPTKDYYKGAHATDVNNDNEQLEFEFDPAKGTHIYEAEASYHPGLKVEGPNGDGQSKPNASGMHQLAGFDKNSHTFSFKIIAAKSGLALLTIGYTGNNATKTDEHFASYYMQITNGNFALNCDNVSLVKADWSADGGKGLYVEVRLGVVYLNKGENTLTFTFVNWDWPDAIAMDYILLTPEIEDVAVDQVDTVSVAQQTALIPEKPAYKEEI